ncbi:MAG: hypothetical protein DCC49_12940 [Acidobacteria bacterium]|nr:MAG: hypothetical protein DCC49_12940 [Acidobacteriota bacterium]
MKARELSSSSERVSRWAIFWWSVGVVIGPIGLITTAPSIGGWFAWTCVLLFSLQFLVGLGWAAITRGRFGPTRVEMPVTIAIDWWIAQRSDSTPRNRPSTRR